MLLSDTELGTLQRSWPYGVTQPSCVDALGLTVFLALLNDDCYEHHTCTLVMRVYIYVHLIYDNECRFGWF